MEDKIKEESRGGGQVSWKQLKCEANKGLQDCKSWPNELPCGKQSSVKQQPPEVNLHDVKPQRPAKLLLVAV